MISVSELFFDSAISTDRAAALACVLESDVRVTGPRAPSVSKTKATSHGRKPLHAQLLLSPNSPHLAQYYVTYPMICRSWVERCFSPIMFPTLATLGNS
jgi:hypothetical protein